MCRFGSHGFFFSYIVFFILPLKFIFCSQDFNHIWKYQCEGHVYGIACDTDREQIFFGSSDNHLYCLNNKGGLVWKYQCEGHVYGIAYDTDRERIFFGSSDKHLYCLNNKGELVWKYQGQGEVYGVSCDKRNKKIFFGSANHLYCVSWDGDVLWEQQVEGNIYSLAFEPKEEKIFVGLDSQSLLCMNKEKEIVWRHETEGTVRSITYSPCDQKVLFSAGDTLYCVSSQGEKNWSYLGENTICGVAYDPIGKNIFCSCGNNSFIQLNGAGELKRTHSIKTLWHLQLSVDSENDILFYPSGNSIYCIDYSAIYEQDAKNQFFHKFFEIEQEKKFTNAMRELSIVIEYYQSDFSPVCSFVFDDYIYYASFVEEGKCTLHFLGRDFKKSPANQDRKLMATFSPTNPPVPNKNGRVYFVSTKGKINYLQNGNQWQLLQDTNEKYSSPTIGSEDMIYFSSDRGVLYCINPNNEEIIWSKNTEEDKIFPSPAIDDKKNVYFASRNHIYKVDSEGQNLEVKTTNQPIKSPLKIDKKNRIYFLSSNNTLRCVDQNGSALWNYHDKNITLPAFDSENLAYLGSKGKIICINPERGGEVLWKQSTKDGARIELPPTANQTGEIYFFAEDGKIYKKRNMDFFERLKKRWVQ